MATWDEASKCPACGMTGKSQAKKPIGGGAIRHTLYCTNIGCEEKSYPWYVEQRADGSIPDPTNHTGHVAIDPAMIDPVAAQRIRDALALNLELSQRPDKHGEIRG